MSVDGHGGAHIERDEAAFEGARGLTLYYQAWRPAAPPPRASVVVVHGFGEHAGRYRHVAERLARRGYAVYAPDHRGHGRSPGPRGHINSWAEFREDVRAMVRLVREREAELPVFLLGHSMGGLIVLEYALHHPETLHGVVASGPLLGTPGVSRVLRVMGRAASRVLPRLSMDTRVDPLVLSRDPATLLELAADPLVHGRASARLGTEIAAATQWTLAHAHELRAPLLLMHGLADRLTPPEGTRLFFERVTYPDKELLLYDGGYHEPFNDIERDRALADVEGWLERHL